MTDTHLAVDGAWVACALPVDACGYRLHIPGISPEAARLLPAEPLLALLMLVDPPSRIDREGAQVWLNAAGQVHRDHDLPAWVHPSGARAWYRAGLLHRESGPARVWPHDGEEWWWHGRRHRTTGPAYTHPRGDAEHWLYGRYVPPAAWQTALWTMPVYQANSVDPLDRLSGFGVDLFA